VEEVEQKEEQESEGFDYVDFMLCCCMDEYPTKALRKAFLVFEDEKKMVSKKQVIKIFQHFLSPVGNTDRNTEAGFMNPFPQYRLNAIFEEEKGEKITFDRFQKKCAELDMGEWLTCPLYIFVVCIF
jgi:hypothetical protein